MDDRAPRADGEVARMAFLDDITPLLITHDEIANIQRTLAKLSWARRVVVIDSGSTDGTLELLSKDPRVEVIHRPFDSFAEQCNFGLTKIPTPWVLSMDADYRLSDALIAERLAGIAEETGATRAQVALAWLLSKRGVAAPIIGTSREEQLDELLNAVDLTLTPEQIAELETPYQQHPVVGFK